MSGTRGVALVIDAARCIGLAIATHLAEAGYSVALQAGTRSADKAKAEAVRLAALGYKTCVVVADLTEPPACEDVIAQAAKALGPLRLLVNNAAIFEADRVDTLDLALWDRQFAINLRAPILLAQAFAAQVDTSGEDGDAAIVNIIDRRVLRPTPQFFSYTLSTSALWTATRTMAQAFAERGVRVNAVGPGPALPNATDGDKGLSKEFEDMQPYRAVDPAEIAAAVLYLAEARAVTGQMIAVDAGQGGRTPDVMD